MSGARILERGYRRYDGPRQGEGHAVRSLLAHTLRRILGLRRPARSKVLPVAAIAFAYLPAIVFIGIVALFGDRVQNLVPHYSDYYSFIVSAILLFVTFVAPEALCPDRRAKTLSLYLASPLTRATYLAAKVGAVFLVLCAVTLGPLLLLLVGLILQNAGPDGPVAVLGVFVRILVSGLLVAGIYTAISMAVSSVTDRRAIASAATLILLLASNVVAGVLTAASGGSNGFFLLSLTRMPFEVVHRIFGIDSPLATLDVATPVVYAAAAVVILGGSAICVLRYHRLQVTR